MSITFYQKNLDQPDKYDRPGARISLTQHAGPDTLEDRSCVQITIDTAGDTSLRVPGVAWVSLTKLQALDLVYALEKYLRGEDLQRVD